MHAPASMVSKYNAIGSMRQLQWRLIWMVIGCASSTGALILKGGYVGKFFEILIILIFWLKILVIFKYKKIILWLREESVKE